MTPPRSGAALLEFREHAGAPTASFLGSRLRRINGGDKRCGAGRQAQQQPMLAQHDAVALKIMCH
jgi:hypothetical protein